METAYVGNGVSAGNAQSTVGKTVIQALETKYASNNTIGKATISVDVTRDANNEITGGTVTIFTTDFEVVGTIDVNGGNLSWGEIENNIPGIKGVPETLSMDTGETKTINATLKGITGTITWTSSDDDVATVSNGVITAASTITNNTATVTITATLGSYSESCTVTVQVAPQVGEVVNYAPNQTYTWDYSLAESDRGANTGTNTGTTSLSSSITQWKILNYNPSTKMVEMVPSTVPTSSSSNKLTLRGAQGYNNAVYLLNNACNSLYGNGTTITARSINEEDFINASAIDSNVSTNNGNKWLNYRADYTNPVVTKADSTNVKYGEQKNRAYTSSYSNYPVMYAYDNNSVINGETPSTASLGLSVQNESIASTKDGATNGYLNASQSIQPYQTYYYTGNNSTTVGLLDSTKAGLLVPSNAQYWVASRCVSLGSDYCGFNVCYVSSGYLGAGNVFYSDTPIAGPAYALFPVVSLSSELLEPSTTSGVAWEVDAN